MTQTAEATQDTADVEHANEVRWPFVFVCCVPLLALRIKMLFVHPQLGDFISYWASGRLFLTGSHPYSEAAMLATERLQGWPYVQPMMTFCPPWTLPTLAVMAWFPFRTAQICWFAISLLLNCFSALGLWVYFGGDKQKAWIAMLVLATFFPMSHAELLGQITPLMLASLTALLLFLKSGRQFTAGVFLLGLGFKPQLLYLLFLAMLFWIIKARAWRVLAGGLAGYGGATAIAQLYNPNSLDYFRHTFRVAVEVSCGVGGVLRSIFGVQHIWLQFLPCLFGIIWFLYCWARNRSQWAWKTHLPLLLMISVSSSPYFWNHDFILVLPALIAVAVHGGYRNFFTLVSYLVVQEITFAAYGYGFSDAWRSATGILWIVFYFVAKAEMASQAGLGTLEAALHSQHWEQREA